MAPPASRILYVYDGKLRPHGIDAVVLRQLAALSAAGYHTDLVARGPANLPAVRDHVARLTLANLVSWLPRPIYYGAQRRLIARRAAPLLRKNPYAAIISWPQRALHVFRAAAPLGIPCLLNCDIGHFATILRPPDYRPRWPDFQPSELAEEYTLARLLLLTSDFARDTFLAHGLPPEKLAVIGRGVDTLLFTPDPSPPPPPGSPFRLLFCGRVGERKGIRQVLEAWQHAAPGLPPGSELHIIGDLAPEARQLPQEHAADPTIRFLGFRTDTPPLMRHCHAQILLSRREGQAKSLLEGAASGLATLATPECGFPLHENINGHHMRRDDPHHNAQLILQLARDPLRTRALGANARQLMLDHYSWDAFSTRFLQALADTIPPPPPRPPKTY